MTMIAIDYDLILVWSLIQQRIRPELEAGLLVAIMAFDRLGVFARVGTRYSVMRKGAGIGVLWGNTVRMEEV